jgi:hypothetical protein
VLALPDGLPLPVLCTVGNSPVDQETWGAAIADLPPMQSPITLPWDELPRTATWKVRRNELRRRLLDAEPAGEGRWT